MCTVVHIIVLFRLFFHKIVNLFGYMPKSYKGSHQRPLSSFRQLVCKCFCNKQAEAASREANCLTFILDHFQNLYNLLKLFVGKVATSICKAWILKNLYPIVSR